MKTKNLMLTVIFFVGLGGCNSFNTNRYESNLREAAKEAMSTTPANPNITSDVRKKAEEFVEQENPEPVERPKNSKGKDTICPMYVPRRLPPPPPIPSEQLAKVGPRDNKALDAIERQHIIDVRRYVQDVNRMREEDYARYVNSCRSYDKRHFKD